MKKCEIGDRNSPRFRIFFTFFALFSPWAVIEALRDNFLQNPAGGHGIFPQNRSPFQTRTTVELATAGKFSMTYLVCSPWLPSRQTLPTRRRRRAPISPCNQTWLLFIHRAETMLECNALPKSMPRCHLGVLYAVDGPLEPVG